MPLIDNDIIANYTSTDGSKRKSWGVFLYPPGERNLADFFVETSDNLEDQRKCLFGVQTGIALMVVILYLFVHNLFIACRMTMRRPRSIISWCCLAATGSAIINGTLVALAMLGVAFNCRNVVWGTGTSMSIGFLCNGLILLHKAYLVSCRQKWIIYVSIPFILTEMLYMLVLTHVTFTSFDVNIGCAMFYPPAFLWFWAGAVAPLNILFSMIFCRVAYRQYRLFGSDAWKRLARDGIQTLCIAALSNTACCLLIVTHFGRTNTDFFLVTDWAIVTTVLIHHCRDMRKMNSSSHRPKTNYVLHLSQIATAASANIEHAA
ncbi:hypothetical protein BDF22DRAFT_694952 [Syncephalis plumigaleata]|nr:hypothetical protein BDF22DRAFT_694952 [Syncephalis plumigaleata]